MATIYSFPDGQVIKEIDPIEEIKSNPENVIEKIASLTQNNMQLQNVLQSIYVYCKERDDDTSKRITTTIESNFNVGEENDSTNN